MLTLSIVIPTKNEEAYLPFLLDSIRSQSFQPKEVIVADAKSTDHTREIAKKAGARVVDGGMPGPGRNCGAKVATGELILFLDADVILLDKDFLQKTVAQFKKQGLDIGSAFVLPINGNTIDKIFHEIYNLYAVVLERVHPHAAGFFIIVKKSLHEQIHGFDEAVRLAEDHDYAWRAAKLGKFRMLRGIRIPVSVRRFDRDGRLNIAIKYLLGEFHIMFIGPIKHDKFKYGFGYSKK
jgi:glycosyltransferase involved in cell wall biosynthesis